MAYPSSRSQRDGAPGPDTRTISVLPVYLGSLALGGLIIIASIFLGAGDHDADADLDIDADGDLDLDADADADLDLDADADADVDHDLDKDVDVSDVSGGTWLPFLSLRFWTFALATFGGAGTLFELLDFSDLVAAPTAAVTGIGVGWVVSWAFHKLKQERVSGDTGLRSIRGREGRLMLPVGPDKLGKVRVVIDGQTVDLMARTSDGRMLDIRDKVLVVQVDDGVAEVTSIQASSRGKSDATD